MASPIASNNDASLLTLPLDLLTNITNKLAPRDEKALKLTCKRMNFLIARPPSYHQQQQQLQHQDHHDSLGRRRSSSSFLTVGVSRDLIPVQRDGRSTPIPQSPLPFKAAKTLQELEMENKEVEEREVERGMELSDDEDRGSVISSSSHMVMKPNKKYKVKKNILNWTAELDSAPSSPGLVRSPSAVGGFATHQLDSPRAASPTPALPTFTLTIQ